MAEIENNALVAVDQAPPPPAEARRGRQRVEMKKMENEKNLQVTFSKRRNGIFKKACELSTLCGGEMALIIFSPSDKVYTFGTPSVDAVLDRYTSLAADAGDGGFFTETSVGDGGFFSETSVGDGGVVPEASSLGDLTARLAELNSAVDAERKKGAALSQQRQEAVAAGRWWEAPLETIDDIVQLTLFAETLENLKIYVKYRNNRLMAETNAAIAAMGGPMYGNGGFSGGGGGLTVPPFNDYMYNNNIFNDNNAVAYPYNFNDNNGFF